MSGIRKPAGPHYRRAEGIVRRLQAEGHLALLAGGCVRDLLMGRIPEDYDIATSARPRQVEELFPETRAVGKQFGVIVVLMDGQQFEVATFRTEAGYADGRHPDRVAFSEPEQDARRRDFTINAMFWDPIADEVLDFVGGKPDLQQGLVRAVGRPEERFREDHLRLLRAIRFAARFGFRLETATRQAIRRLAGLVNSVSAERLQQELRIILTDLAPARALRLMDRLGMLTVIFPELEPARGCEQPRNYHPEGDVFVHSILTVEKLGPRPAFEVAMAALLHDVGKPKTAEGGDRIRFPEHSPIGRDITRRICRRLKLSNAETDRICWLVERHMYFKDARNMKRSTLKRLFAADGFEQLAELHRADALASSGDLGDYLYVMAKRRAMSREATEPEPLVTGHDLIEMGYEPGPLFAEVLEEVREQQLEGDVTDQQEARELARRLAERLSEGAGEA